MQKIGLRRTSRGLWKENFEASADIRHPDKRRERRVTKTVLHRHFQNDFEGYCPKSLP
jgi:hypothetical protein